MFRLIIFLMLCAVASVAPAQIPTPVPFKSPAGNAAPVMAPPAAGGSVAASGLLGGYVPDATYKLRAGDAISFQILEDHIWNALDAPKSLVVTDSGELDVPYIGRMMAVDKTCQQLADEMKAALEKDYYHKATVVLSLNVANRLLGRVYIWGQVRSQGALDMQMNENLTAGQAVLRAGGFADFANKNKVKVVRGSVGAKGEKQTFDLDMEQILEKGKTEQDILLQPGDLIIVPSRLINF
jgi:protein involved in polysaccharide export with SLBB domain